MTETVLAEPHTPEWYAQRRKGIGASEIAAVMGISPWESPFSLYWRKVEGWEVEETDRMRTGTLLEPAIAAWAAETIDPNNNWADFVPGWLIAHYERPWQLATPDRIVRLQCETCPGGLMCTHEAQARPLAPLELKWTGSWDGWGDEDTDQIPVQYRAQVLWQCDVLGVDEWYVAVLGPSGFRLYRGRQDPKDIAVMVEAGRRFMARIEAQDPPPIDDHSATLTTLKLLHPDLDDETVTVPDDVAEGYLRAVRMVKLAEKVRDRYEIQLRDLAGSARRIESWSGKKVATHVITDVAAEKEPRGPHRKDYLLPPRERKTP